MKFEAGKVYVSRRELRALAAHVDGSGESTMLCGSVHFDGRNGYAIATDGHRIARLNAEGEPSVAGGLISLPHDASFMLCALPWAREFVVERAGDVIRAEARTSRGKSLCVCLFDPPEPAIEITNAVLRNTERPKVDAPRAPVFSLNPHYLADLRKVRRAALPHWDVTTDERLVAPEESIAPVFYIAGLWTVAIMPLRTSEAERLDDQTKAWREKVVSQKVEPPTKAALVAKAPKRAGKAK